MTELSLSPASGLLRKPSRTADTRGAGDGAPDRRHRYDALSWLTAAILLVCVTVVLWKMGLFRLPSQVAYDRAAAAGKPAPHTNLLTGIFDWLSPWRWRRGDLLSTSTPTGGDMGAHVWAPDFIKRSLIPKGRLTGWSDDWFGGMAVINFYFPLPMLTIVALSYIVPYQIAFKLVTVLGLTLIPITAWRAGTVAGLRRPVPIFMSLAAMTFIFSRNFDLPIYGGNVQSTMAGEFSFSISLSFAILFLGYFTRVLRTGEGRGRTAVLLAITGLSHLLPTIWAVAFAFFLFLAHLDRSRLQFRHVSHLLGALTAALGLSSLVAIVDTKPHAIITLAFALLVIVLADWITGHFRLGQIRDVFLVMAFGGAIAGFWIVPFFFNLPYTNDMGWEKMSKYVANLFPFWAGKDGNGKGLKPYADSGLVAVAMVFAVVGALSAWGSVFRAMKTIGSKRRPWSASVMPIAIIAASIVGLGVSLVTAPWIGLAAAVVTVGVGWLGYAAFGDSSDGGAFVVIGVLLFGCISATLFADRSILSVALIAVAVFSVIMTRVALSGVDFERWPAALTIMIGVLATLFRFSPQFRLWNARALPFWFFSIALLAAYGVAQVPRLARFCLGLFYREPQRRQRTGNVFGTGFVATAVFVGVGLPLNLVPRTLPIPDVKGGRVGVKLAKDSTDSNPGPGWAAYNFAGYEARAWTEYKAFMDEANRIGKDNGCGRAHWEYDDARLSSYGTTLSLMLLPYWTRGCIGSMEGVYFESSATAPFHWLTAAHTTAPTVTNADGTKKYSGPSNPQRFLRYPAITIDTYPEFFKIGVTKMRQEGVRYYVALTDVSARLAGEHPDLKRVGGSGPFAVFEVKGYDLVEPLTEEPVVVTGIDQDQVGGWLDVQQEWYLTPQNYPANIVWAGPKQWQRAKATVKKPKNEHNVGVGTSMESVRRKPLPPITVTNITRNNVDIAFSVSEVGVPVVVKTGYFPNWKVTGAKGPYRVMPNFMVVIPTQKNVRLDYGYSLGDKLGYTATLSGLAGVVLLRRRKRKDGLLDLEARADHARSLIPKSVADADADTAAPWPSVADAPMVSAHMVDTTLPEGAVLEETVLEGDVPEGDVLEGDVPEGDVLDGDVLEGDVLEGDVLEETIEVDEPNDVDELTPLDRLEGDNTVEDDPVEDDPVEGDNTVEDNTLEDDVAPHRNEP